MQLLGAGEQGRISGVDGRREMTERLEEMGLRHGAHVRMVQPGSPCIVAINNYRMSFRGEDTAVVLVEPFD